VVAFYRHSGRAHVLSIPIVVIKCLLVVPIASVAYSFILVYVPLLFFYPLLPVAYGLGVGSLVGSAAFNAKIRNYPLALLLGLAATLGGYYVIWGADLIARVGLPRVGDMWQAWSPEVLLRYIDVFYHHGFWEFRSFGPFGHPMGGATVKGGLLGFAWFVELGLILFFVWLRIAHYIARNTFCEACYRWSENLGLVANYAYRDEGGMTRYVLDCNLPELLAQPLVPLSASVCLQIYAHRCPTCDEHACVTLKKMVASPAYGNTIRNKATLLVDRMLYTKDELNPIVAYGRTCDDERGPDDDEA
jgi:hypothetical protein